MNATFSQPKRILYAGPTPEHYKRLVRRLADSGLTVDGEGPERTIHTPCGPVTLVCACRRDALVDNLRTRYVHAFLLDTRGRTHDAWLRARDAGRAALDLLDAADDIETRYGFHRIVAITGGPNRDEVDSWLAELGARGVRNVRRQRGRAAEFEAAVLCDTLTMIGRRTTGRSALCASGGGITGIYFELGALKCLDDALPSGALHDFDMYFGISAGAVVLGLVAAGYSPAEIMASIAGVDRGRVPPMSLSLLRLGHLNLPDIRKRATAAARAAARQLSTVLHGRIREGVEDAFLEYTALVGPPFHSGRFEELLRGLLTVPGTTNDFRAMPRRFYVGATDQDRRAHVLFGHDEIADVPISKAIQASLSIHPAFSSVEVDGRWYEDGAVTRTSGFADAVTRGADLIFVVDPFVPYVSTEAGAANRKGILYNLDQELRTISYTRYQSTRDWALRRYPEVSSYTFLPSNRARQLLSTNPMDHRPYLPIWKGAYLSTLRRLERLEARLRGDLNAHGHVLDLERARDVALRLRAIDDPRFEDFFVGGRVEIPTPPFDPMPISAGRASSSGAGALVSAL